MPRQKKDRYLTIRVSPKELDQYTAAADMVGLSTSSWVRFILKQAVDAAEKNAGFKFGRGAAQEAKPAKKSARRNSL